MKTNWIKIIICFAALLCADCCYAQSMRELAGKERSAAIAELEGKNKAIKSFTGLFHQTRKTTLLKESVESSGRISFKRDDFILWEYEKPQSKVIKIRGGDVTVDGTHRGKPNRMTKGISNMVSEMLQGGKVVDEKTFDFAIYDGGKSYCVKAKPIKREMQRMMAAVDITFNKADGTVHKIILTEKDGNCTIIEFDKLKVDKQK